MVRPDPAAMSRLLSLYNAVDGLATTTAEILAHPEVAKAIEQELVRALISCLTDCVNREPSASSDESHAAVRANARGAQG